MGTFPIMLLLMQWTRFQVSFQAYENLESLDWDFYIDDLDPPSLKWGTSHQLSFQLFFLTINSIWTICPIWQQMIVIQWKGVRNMQIMYSQIFFAIHAFVEEFLWKQRAWGPSSNASLKISKKGDQWALTIVNSTHGRAFRKQRFPSIQKFLIFLKGKQVIF